jgi:hypothetical protein
MILIDGFLVNFESSQFANQNWNCPPSPIFLHMCSTIALPWELMEFTPTVKPAVQFQDEEKN